MMTHSLLRPGALLAMAMVLTACGNFSNDDLLFLTSLPTAKELELVVEGSDQSPAALTLGQTAQFYEQADQVAGAVNAGVDELLKMVDGLGKGSPPTRRRRDTRVWGPVENLDGKGITLRLEIRRSSNDDGGPRFTFCLHLGSDVDFAGGGVKCEERNSQGLDALLWGFYSPKSIEEGARSGAGEINFDLEVLRRLDRSEQGRGFLGLVYDFRDGGDAKQIHVDVEEPSSTDSTLDILEYNYGRTLDGYVDFYFEFSDDIIDADSLFSSEERLSLGAQWQEGGLGRADVLIDNGDLAAGESATATECWDETHRRTYYLLVLEKSGTYREEEGDPDTCPAG